MTGLCFYEKSSDVQYAPATGLGFGSYTQGSEVRAILHKYFKTGKNGKYDHPLWLDRIWMVGNHLGLLYSFTAATAAVTSQVWLQYRSQKCVSWRPSSLGHSFPILLKHILDPGGLSPLSAVVTVSWDGSYPDRPGLGAGLEEHTLLGKLPWGVGARRKALLPTDLDSSWPQRPPHSFLVNMKLEAVDRRTPSFIRVASVEDVEDHRIKVGAGVSVLNL